MVPKSQIYIFDTIAELCNWVIPKWRAIAQKAVLRKGYFSVGLSGGETPRPLYMLLPGEKNFPWKKTHIFLVDERHVECMSPQSNYRMIQETLSARNGMPACHIYPMPTHYQRTGDVAEKYENQLKMFFRVANEDIPKFDLMILGMGEDGHVASLFPEMDFHVQNRLTIPVDIRKLENKRISLTLSVINHASHIVFLVTGRAKAKTLRAVIDGKKELPASWVNPVCGELYFLADRQASHHLS